MRIFLTGATGVIGSRVVPLLLERGHAVTGVARSAAKRSALEHAGATPLDVNLFDRAALEKALDGHDAIVNLATHVPHSTLQQMRRSAWRENDHIRRDGSAALADAALASGTRRFIQESFAPIYGDHGADWIDERAPLQPIRYNRTVLDAELSARRFASGGGIGVVLRFGGFYGPDAVQLRALLSAIRRGWAPLPGRDDSYLSSLSHDDAATAVVAALALPTGVYNVVDDQPVTHRELVDALADAAGAPHPRLPPAWATVLTGSVGRLLARSQRISNRKLRGAADWAPRYPSVREGYPAAVAAIGG